MGTMEIGFADPRHAGKGADEKHVQNLVFWKPEIPTQNSKFVEAMYCNIRSAKEV